MMKLLIIGTTVYALPPQGYSGVEMLVFQLVEGLHRKGNQVTVVAPEGSQLSEGIELIATGLREDEEKAWARYRGRLEGGEWPIIVDASWQRWASLSNAQRDPQIPIVNWFHSSPTVYGSQPPVRWPLWVGLSKSHAEELALAWKVPAKWIWNGIDLDFYKADGRPRGDRYLWLQRWTPEKGGADLISLAQGRRFPLDMYGDTEIVGGQAYVGMCFSRADGLLVRVSPGISRAATVEAYSSHKGNLLWLNWQEPFSLGIIESMACGCPPIVARRGGPTELVRDGVTGFLVDDLEQMGRLIQRDAVREINPEAMRQHVEKHFGLGSFVGRWEDLLQKVLAGDRW